MNLFVPFLISVLSVLTVVNSDDEKEASKEISDVKAKDDEANASEPFDNVEISASKQEEAVSSNNDREADQADSIDEGQAVLQGEVKADPKEELEDPQFQIDMKKGQMADFFPSNPHLNHPSLYKDFGRRYEPLEEISNGQQNIDNEEKMQPLRASPDLVLALAAASVKQQSKHPVDPDEYTKLALRGGDQWDSFWKEDVDPDNLPHGDQNTLAVPNNVPSNDKPTTQHTPLDLKSIPTKIKKGTPLAKLVSILKPYSSALLYIINKKKE